MFKRRGLVLVVLSLVMGTLAAVVANNWLDSRLLPEANAQMNMVTVVVAAMDVPYGTKVETRHLRLLQIVDTTVPPNSFATIEEAEGQVAKIAIESGEVLLKSKFAEHEQGSKLAALVQKEMRAITVRVDDVVGVAGFLLPGNHVDVIGVRGGQRGGQNERAASETVLHNIKVLAVDQTTASDQNEPIVVRAVTLELSPAQALILVKARAEGEINLTLRNPLDSLVAKAPEPAPVKKVVAKAWSPPPDATIQVIRGTNVAKEKTKI